MVKIKPAINGRYVVYKHGVKMTAPLRKIDAIAMAQQYKEEVRLEKIFGGAAESISTQAKLKKAKRK